jgi:glutathione S-transferase
MKLIWSPTSPFARKVRVAAFELDLHDRIDLANTEVRPGKFDETYSRNVNPLRKLPALVIDGGETLVDSLVICDYLDGLAGGGKLIPRETTARARALTAHAVASGMTDALVLLRYETFLRPEELRWKLWCDDQWERAWAGLAWFDARPALLTPEIDIARIALACALGYFDFRFGDRPWRPVFPAVAAFADAFNARASMKTTAPPA